jgi:SAM-dependent methyltransferase
MSHHSHSMHGHMWIMGLVGVLVGGAIMIVLPQMQAVSGSILLFAGFHVLGAVVLLSSAWVAGVRNLVRRAPTSTRARLEFGWGPGWMNGLAIAALVFATLAVALQVIAPPWWPLADLGVAVSVILMVGNLVMRGFRRKDQVVLPMVDLVRGPRDVVLDAGCGSGRTTIALSRVLRDGHVVAVDRFDAGYIDDGGRALLERNLELTGLSERVSIETADLTDLPFDEGDFDAAVSTHVYDHLGRAKQRGLSEVFRTLKPGGRFLMVVWTPGWSMFAVANLFSFFLTSKTAWRRMAGRAGFAVVDEGAFNHAWFVLMEKPVAA